MSRSSKCALLFGLAFVVCVTWFPAALLTKYLVDIVALGHSLAKTLLLLLFCLLLSVLIKVCPAVSPKVRPAFLVLLFGSFLATLAQFLWYCHRFDLKPSAWSAVVRDGRWTMSRLDHSHTAKAILSSLPPGLATKTDVGYAFGSIFPQTLLLLGLLVFLVLLVLCTGSCLQFIQTESAGRAASFVLVSFVLVKCVIDGGLLIPEVWAAFPVLSWLLAGRKGLYGSLIITGIYLGSLFFWKPEAGGIVVFNWLPGVLALSTPIFWERKRWLGVLGLSLILLSPLCRYVLQPSSRMYPYALNTGVYGVNALHEGWTVHLICPHKPSSIDGVVEVKQMVQESNSGYFLVEARILKATNVYTLCREMDLELVRLPVSWYHGRVAVEADIILLEGTIKDLRKSPFLHSAIMRGSRLSVVLPPGVNRDLAISMLGAELTIVHDFRLSYPGAEK